MNDGENVIGEFFVSGLSIVFTENHEFDSKGIEDPIQKVEGKPTQSVPVGNHNF
jgi:hypothetical protein